MSHGFSSETLGGNWFLLWHDYRATNFRATKQRISESIIRSVERGSGIMARESPFSSITFALLISHLFPHFLNIKKNLSKKSTGWFKANLNFWNQSYRNCFFFGSLNWYFLRNFSKNVAFLWMCDWFQKFMFALNHPVDTIHRRYTMYLRTTTCYLQLIKFRPMLLKTFHKIKDIQILFPADFNY